MAPRSRWQRGQGWTAQDFPTAQYYHVATTEASAAITSAARSRTAARCASAATACRPVGAQIAQAQAAAPRGQTGRGRGAGARAWRRRWRTRRRCPDDVRRRRLRERHDRTGPEGCRHHLRRRQQRDVPDAAQSQRPGKRAKSSPYPRMFSGEPSSALVERWTWNQPLIFSHADPDRSLHIVPASVEDDQWRPELDEDQRRPHEARSEDDGALGRPDHRRHERSGGLRHDLRHRSGQDRREHHLGRIRRRPRPRDARRRQDLGERDAEGDAGVRPRQPDRRVPIRVPAQRTSRSRSRCSTTSTPYIFRTTDFGKSWTKIINGIAPLDYVHVVREDRQRKGLLYAGTQHGVLRFVQRRREAGSRCR